MKTNTRLKITKTSLIGLFIFMCALVSNHSYAQKLSAATIEHWIQSAPELADFFKQNQALLDTTGEIDFISSPPSDIAKQASSALKKVKLYDQFKTKIQSQGYNSVENFLLLQAQIIQGYVQVAKQAYTGSDEVQQQVKESLDELDASEFLTQEQKDQMKQQMLSMFKQLQVPNRSKESTNLKLIRQYADKIQHTLEQFSDDE